MCISTRELTVSWFDDLERRFSNDLVSTNSNRDTHKVDAWRQVGLNASELLDRACGRRARVSEVSSETRITALARELCELTWFSDQLDAGAILRRGRESVQLIKQRELLRLGELVCRMQRKRGGPPVVTAGRLLSEHDIADRKLRGAEVRKDTNHRIALTQLWRVCVANWW